MELTDCVSLVSVSILFISMVTVDGGKSGRSGRRVYVGFVVG